MSTTFFVAPVSRLLYYAPMSVPKQLRAENLAYLAEILEDDYLELGPQDRAAMLLLVRLFQHGLEESEEEPPCAPGPVTEMYQSKGSCAHCQCYEEGDMCCGCGESNDNPL